MICKSKNRVDKPDIVRNEQGNNCPVLHSNHMGPAHAPPNLQERISCNVAIIDIFLP